jgi:hypothetical protein
MALVQPRMARGCPMFGSNNSLPSAARVLGFLTFVVTGVLSNQYWPMLVPELECVVTVAQLMPVNRCWTLAR